MHLPQLPNISSSIAEYHKNIASWKRSQKHTGSDPERPAGIRGFVKSLRNENEQGTQDNERVALQTIPHEASQESLGLGKRKDSLPSLRHSQEVHRKKYEAKEPPGLNTFLHEEETKNMRRAMRAAS